MNITIFYGVELWPLPAGAAFVEAFFLYPCATCLTCSPSENPAFSCIASFFFFFFSQRPLLSLATLTVESVEMTPRAANYEKWAAARWRTARDWLRLCYLLVAATNRQGFFLFCFFQRELKSNCDCAPTIYATPGSRYLRVCAWVCLRLCLRTTHKAPGTSFRGVQCTSMSWWQSDFVLFNEQAHFQIASKVTLNRFHSESIDTERRTYHTALFDLRFNDIIWVPCKCIGCVLIQCTGSVQTVQILSLKPRANKSSMHLKYQVRGFIWSFNLLWYKAFFYKDFSNSSYTVDILTNYWHRVTGKSHLSPPLGIFNVDLNVRLCQRWKKMPSLAQSNIFWHKKIFFGTIKYFFSKYFFSGIHLMALGFHLISRLKKKKKKSSLYCHLVLMPGKYRLSPHSEKGL